MTILGAVSKLAVPDVPIGDRYPQIADEVLRVQGGVDDAMVLPDQLLPAVAGDLAEFVVDVRDLACHVGRRHDRGMIERPFQIGELRCGLNLRHRYTWTWPPPEF